MPDGKDPSLARSLGQFFGHVFRGVTAPTPAKTDPNGATRHEVRREVEQEQVQTPQGPVVLRRTIIEEVEIKRADS